MKIFLFLIFYLVVNNVNSQSIYRTWYSEKDDICMSFKLDGFSVIMGSESYRVKYCKNGKLKILDYPAPKNSRKHYTYKYRIIELNENELIIESISKESHMELPNGKMNFKVHLTDCM